MIAEIKKTCSRCGTEKPLSGFSKRKANSDGYHYNCLECTRAEGRKRSRLSAEQCRQRSREYRRLHPKACNDRTKQWRAKQDIEGLRAKGAKSTLCS